MRKENWFALGLIFVVLGLVTFAFANISVKAEDYSLVASVDNTQTPTKVSISGNFASGEQFFFNFTKGHYWGVEYDQTNGGLEPQWNDFSNTTSLPPYKVVTFYLHTPSGGSVPIDVYVIHGTDPFAVVYENQTSDYTPLWGGNLSLINLGVAGIINQPGIYGIEGVSVVPLILKGPGQNNTYTLVQDPPLLMKLWTVNTSESVPYFIPSISLGTIVIASGVGSCIWAIAPKKQGRHSKKTAKK